MRLVLSPLALRDLQDIHDYIARDNPDAASAFLDRVDLRLEMIKEHPQIGRKREEFPPGVRSSSEGNYVIVYRLLTDQNTIEIARVLHSKRNIKRIIKADFK